MFNIIGTAVCLTLFVLADALFSPAILGESASYLGIAICHTVFNVICTTLMLPPARAAGKAGVQNRPRREAAGGGLRAGRASAGHPLHCLGAVPCGHQ